MLHSFNSTSHYLGLSNKIPQIFDLESTALTFVIVIRQNVTNLKGYKYFCKELYDSTKLLKSVCFLKNR